MLYLNSPYASEQKCFNIKKISLEGKGVILDQKQKLIISQKEGKCLNLDSINNLVRELTNNFIQNGYITSRVEVPPQDLSQGKLTLNVAQGYIENIEYQSSEEKFTYDTVFSDLKGKVLNLRDLEQSFDNFNGLRSNDANLELKPGINKGGSIVVIKNKPKKRWRVFTGFDNSGGKSKTKHQGFIGAEIDNLLGLHDTINLNHKSSVPYNGRQQSKAASIIISIPSGYNRYSFNYEYGKHQDPLDVNTRPQLYHGHHYKGGVNLTRVVYRDNQSKILVSTGVRKSNYTSKIDDIKLLNQSYKLTAVEFGASIYKRIFSGLMKAGLSIEKGVSYDSTRDRKDLEHYPTAKFDKILYDLSWLKSITTFKKIYNLMFSTSLRGQFTPHVLYGSEKFELGGLGAVRGYSDKGVASDNGAFLRNELILSLPNQFQDFNRHIGNLQIFAGLDIGKYKKNDDSVKKQGTVSGLATGLKTEGGAVNFSLTVARALPWGKEKKRSHDLSVYLGLSVEL
jgi:hemolysin activation/secretion protein